LEATVARIGMEVAAPDFPYTRCRFEEGPADHPGILERPSVRPDDPAFHRRAAAEYHVDFPAADAWLQVEPDVGVRIEPATAGLAFVNHLIADRLEHVIVAGAHDGKVARLGQGRELKRAIGRR